MNDKNLQVHTLYAKYLWSQKAYRKIFWRNCLKGFNYVEMLKRNFILFSFCTGISVNLMKKLKMEFWERERIHEITSGIPFADWGLVKVF